MKYVADCWSIKQYQFIKKIQRHTYRVPILILKLTVCNINLLYTVMCTYTRDQVTTTTQTSKM